ncbi:hypothetical protein V8C86DRAFT_3135932 [Haematococcus lacustris]
MGMDDIAHEAGSAFKSAQVMAYNALTWYFSWYYWAAGIAYGLTSGLFYAVTQYYSTLFQDAMLVLQGKRPTAGIEPTPAISSYTTTTTKTTAPAPRSTAPATLPSKAAYAAPVASTTTTSSTVTPGGPYMKVSPPTMPATALPAY